MAKTTATLGGGAGTGGWSNAGIWNNGVPDPAVDTWSITAGDVVNIDISIPDLSGNFTNAGTINIDEDQAGVTVGVVPADMVIAENCGTITTNNGIITLNSLIVVTNNARVDYNSGYVYVNSATGTIQSTNSAYIFVNRGSVNNNETDAVIGANFGTVGTNNGTILTDLTNCVAGNIKDGVTIGGVAGTFTHTDDYVAKTDVVAASNVALDIPRWTGATGVGYVGTAVLTAANVKTAIETLTAPTLSGPATTPLQMLVAIWRSLYKGSALNRGTGLIEYFADDGATPIATVAFTESATVETRGAAT